jgi:hypothetical protein
MAIKKRTSKVAKGAFKDTNIQYFDETVVIWNIREFMSVTKWREDALRRSKRLDGGGDDRIGRRNRGNDHDDNNMDGRVVELTNNKKPKQSRRKKFAEVCQVLLQNSLSE